MELVVCPGFGTADDWIAERAGPGDVIITADIPLAARCLARGRALLGPKGHPFNETDIGATLATRGPARDAAARRGRDRRPVPMSPKDRSRFLSKLDEPINAARRDGTARS